MNNNHLLSHYAYLAEASYADLSNTYETEKVRAKLIESENGGDMGTSLSDSCRKTPFFRAEI